MSDETVKGGSAAAPAAPGAPAPAAAPPGHVALVEALLFASGKPASVERLAEASELTPAEVESALEVLERALESQPRGIRMDRVAGGARLVSRSEFDVPVRKLLGLEGKNKLSMASLETLSIIAYRQPVTAPEIAELRGVSSASSLRTLLDKKLITTAGRKEVVGTPFLYKTTKEFLVHFGLDDVQDLPKPEDLDALYGVETNTSQTELFPGEEGEREEISASGEERLGGTWEQGGTGAAGETAEEEDKEDKEEDSSNG